MKLPLALSVVAAACGVAIAQQPDSDPTQLSDKELPLVLAALAVADTARVASEAGLESADRVQAAGPETEGDTRSPLARASVFAGGGAEEGSRLVETLQFNYREGTTIRRVVEVSEEAADIVREERLDAYPTPLAAEEKTEAVKLAFEQIGELRELAARFGKPAEVVPMTPTNPDPESPTFRHRLTYLNLAFRTGDEGRPQRLRVEVNLTTRQARLLEASPRLGLLPPGPVPEVEGLEIDPGAVDPAAILPAEEGGAAGAGASWLETVEKEFPVGAAAGTPTSAWRVEYSVFGGIGSEVLMVNSASYRPVGETDWIDILGPTHLAEMFVPYANGTTAYYDITGFDFDLLELSPDVLGPACIAPPEIKRDVVAIEYHDTNPLWLGTGSPLAESHRGERLEIWSALGAGNYTYIQFFAFHDDGTIELRSGATAHNFFGTKDDSSTHLHTACWKVQFDLDDASAVSVKTVEYETSLALGPRGQTVVSPFAGGVEGGIAWEPHRFTQLRAESTVTRNAHNPQSYVAYDVLPAFYGLSRNYGVNQDWTHNDLWVTRSQPPAASDPPRIRFRDLPNYIASPLPLAGQPNAIWVKSALLHRARDEDFGRVGYDANEGVATTAWSSLVLKPRNLSSKTPFYP